MSQKPMVLRDLGDAVTERLNIRISERDLAQMRELRDLLCQPSDSATIRTLIRLHHVASKQELARLRRARRNRG
jgi:hypothetical protein